MDVALPAVLLEVLLCKEAARLPISLGPEALFENLSV